MKRTMQTATVLIIAASANAAGIMDTAQVITEHLWMQEYIPDFPEEVIPLSDYEDYEVVELFRAETIDELEAAITDGYPMPWLEEILRDESIPWEDRYWLDCRMRSIFAQDLHLFFDRDGNRIEMEADFIIPGEDYWREHLMINPPGESDLPRELRPSTFYADPGIILDRFGNRVGELAEVFRSVTMSRDASIAAVISGSNACFMYPDGSFREIELPLPGGYKSIVSANGEVIAFECTDPSGTRDPYTLEPTGVTGEVYFFDPSGNLIGSADPYSILSPGERAKLSSDGRYFCDNLSTGELFLCHTTTDNQYTLLEKSEGGWGRTSFHFSPDGKLLCTAGFSTGIVIDLDHDLTIWESSTAYLNEYEMSRIACSNEAVCIASVTRRGVNPDYTYELEVYASDKLIFQNTSEGRYNEEAIVSPNGHFVLSQKDDIMIAESGIPTVIRQIRGEEF